MLDPRSPSQLSLTREKKSGRDKSEVKSHSRRKSGSSGPQVSPSPRIMCKENASFDLCGIQVLK